MTRSWTARRTISRGLCSSSFLPVSQYRMSLFSSSLTSDSCAVVISVDYTKSPETFADTVAKDSLSFIPPGKRIGAYRSAEDEEDDVEYGVWHVRPSSYEREISKKRSLMRSGSCGQCKWDTPGFREFHRRAQLFILLYIEGGSYIQVRFTVPAVEMNLGRPEVRMLIVNLTRCRKMKINGNSYSCASPAHHHHD